MVDRLDPGNSDMKTVQSTNEPCRDARRAAALAALCFAAASASAANYWKGADGADLATAANWSDNALPESAVGYFNGRSEHGADYTATLSADTAFYQFIWGGNAPRPNSTVLNLGGHELTMTVSSARPIRLEADKVSSVTVTNGTLVFASPSEAAWVLGSGQTLAFGEGAIFNGNAALHGSAAQNGSRIVVRDGAKVNGRLYVGDKQSGAEILVAGAGTKADFGGGALALSSTAASSDNVFRVAGGAIATNVAATIGRADCTNLAVCVDGGILGMTSLAIGVNGVSNVLSVCNGGTAVLSSSVNLGYASGAVAGRGGRLAVDSGSEFCTEGWNVSGNGNHTYVGKSGVAGGNEIFVGNGSTYSTRTVTVYGTDNTIAVSNGTFQTVKYTIADGNAFKVSGTTPRIYQTGQNGFSIGENCTLSFDVPESGYESAPFDLYPGSALAMPDTTQLEVAAKAYSVNGGGTVELMSFRGTRDVTFSDTLLDRWNGELAANGASVSWNSATRTLLLKVRSAAATVLCFR